MKSTYGGVLLLVKLQADTLRNSSFPSNVLSMQNPAIWEEDFFKVKKKREVRLIESSAV